MGTGAGRGRRRETRSLRALAVAGTCLATLAACAGSGAAPDDAADAQASGSPTAATDSSATPAPSDDVPVADTEHAVEAPPKLTDSTLPADMLIYSQKALSDEVVDRIKALDGVAAVERLGMGTALVENRAITVASVDPATYRRFTLAAVAQQQDIWERVAGGELAIPTKLGKKLGDKNAFIKLGNDKDAPQVHIGAFAPQVPGIDAAVNEKWGEELEVPHDNALIISTLKTSPQSVRPKVARLLDDDTSIQLLDAVTRFGLDPGALQTAIPTGGSVAQAVGSFSYRVLGGGRIAPDGAWVRANIRTEQVPILGSVTCHKVMLPQLRAALTEVQKNGLADKIHPGEYAGCYYPRFIAGSTSLSNHSFGIALDMNVPGNQRGTLGEMDRGVVAIFKRWGFGWGGDWNYTDPMHFEMNALVKAG
ncbi:MAG: M15 family metallopeptidase [Nocardioides sp.]